MSPLPHPAAHVARTRYLPAFAALVAALLVAACGAAQSSPAGSVAAAGSSDARPSSSVPTAAPTPSATATPFSRPVTAPSPVAASQPQTIHVIEHATNVSQVRVGSLSGCSNTTSCQGDYIVGDDPLSDAVTGKEVGTLAFECFIVTTGDTLYHCPGITMTLTGRGQIVFTEFYWDGVTRPETSPITGGTGEFLGATGTVTSQLGGDFVITITK